VALHAGDRQFCHSAFILKSNNEEILAAYPWFRVSDGEHLIFCLRYSLYLPSFWLKHSHIRLANDLPSHVSLSFFIY
jgi:hypothetical protein